MRAQPSEVLSPDNPQTTTVLELHPKYLTDRYTRESRFLGYFWGPEGTPDKAHHGIESGPGFQATADNFPPGTKLIVTARVVLPDTDQEN